MLDTNEERTAGEAALEMLAADPAGTWTMLRGPWRGERGRLVVVVHEAESPDLAALEPVRGLRHPHVGRLLGGDRLGRQEVVLVSDPGGPSLASLRGARQPVAVLLGLAEGMAQGLVALHAAGLVHGRLEMESYVLDAEGRPLLVDLLVIGRTRGDDPGAHRRAPEQADGIIDARSDLYALGGILYELCAGRPAFDVADPLERRHLALSSQPAPLANVPPGLAALVARLLATDPRDRPRSAAAFLADLAHARRLYDAQGDIPPFAWSLADGGRALPQGEALLGRKPERDQLDDALARAAAGACLRVEVVGPAGIGKTTLIETLRGPTLARGGCFGIGRVDPLGAPRPLGALAGALDEIAAQVLSGDAARLERVRRAVARAVGANGPLIAALGPRLVWLVPGGEPSPRDEGVGAAAARLLHAVERFVLAVAEAAPPLVLALDDLHRADAETVGMFRALASAADARHLLVIGGWRPDEGAIGRERVDGAIRLELGGLDEPALAELLASTLGDVGPESAPLAHLIHRRTQGNPFFVRAFLRHLVAIGAIRGGESGLAVDLEAAGAVDIGAGVAAILVQELRALPASVRDVLAVGARVGDRFPAAFVADVLDRPVSRVEARLAEAVAAGVLARVRATDEEPASWRFLHDRLQQAALDLLPPAAAAALHARLGGLLCAALGPHPQAEALLRAVHQRGLGFAALETAAQRDEEVRWSLRGAQVARTTGAFAAGLGFVDAAFALLGDDPWRRPEEAAALYLEGARAAVIAAPDRVDPFIDRLLERVTEPMLAAEALELRIDLEVARGSPAAALVATRAALDRLGYHLPERVGKGRVVLALVRARFAMRGRSVADLLALPEVTDPRAAAALRVMLRGSTAAYLSDPDLFAYLCGEMVRIGLASGACPGTAWGLLVFAILQSAVLGDAEGGYALGEAARSMFDRHRPHGLEAKVASVWYATQHHTRHPIRDSIKPLEEAVRRGFAEGDSLHAGVNAAFYVNHVVFSGEPLDRAIQDLRRLDEQLQRHNLAIAIETSAPFDQLARCLAGVDDVNALFEGPPPSAAKPYQAFTVNFCRCVLAVLFGRDAEALEHARLADPVRAAVRGTINEPLFLFYGAVAAGRSLAFGGAKDRATRRRLHGGLAEMRRRARTNPVDYTSRVALLEALDIVVGGRPAAALAELDASFRSARSRGAPHEAALALETAARLHADLGAQESARLLRASAAECWRDWGSGPLASVATPRMLPVVRRPPPVEPNLDVVLRATEALAGEVGRDALLASLVRLAAMQAGAERVVLIGVSGEELRVRAVQENGAVAFTSGLPLGEYGRACATAVRLAARTGEIVLEADAGRPDAFGHDPWVRSAGVRAVLALPVFLRGTLTGVLLLEHTHRAAAFAATDVSALRVLASVASALHENAELLSIVEVRAAELRVAHDALQAHSRLLEDAVRARTGELDALTRLQAAVLDALSEGVCGIGDDGRITFANAAAGQLLGTAVPDLVGATFHGRFHVPEGEARRPCPLCDASTPLQDVPARLRTADGALRWVECAVQPGCPGDRAGIRVVSFRDVGRRRELEEQVRHSQKMEAIGLFVGGVAHEFNNLLTPILGRVELAREILGAAHPLQASLGSVAQAGERAAELVRQLLALGRRTEVVHQPTDIAATVAEALGFVRPALDRRIQVTYRAVDGAWALADHGQVHQVVLNLCLNARDAILGAPRSDGLARIDLAVRRAEVDAAAAALDPDLRVGSWIELEISDTGPGMAPDVLSRIFEPFFTTKDFGEGSGLGLAVLHGIVLQHGGWVSVRSAPGEGTTFRCAFPATAPPAPLLLLPPPPPPVAVRGRILLVDDEEGVRSLARAVLERQGYVVEEAADGLAALGVVERGPRPDAVVLDLVMPGLDGWRTLARIRELDPTLPVVVMSGYDSRGGEGRPVEPDAQLAKPFRLRDLVATVARVLAVRRPS
ncbi:MAG: AAA family ATPase [Pseudomonadota bacterium]|nr:AAA family ATPase [Pseudomonadota bacterium]